VPGQPKGLSFPAHPSGSILPGVVLYPLLHVSLAGVLIAACRYSPPLLTGKNFARVPVYPSRDTSMVLFSIYVSNFGIQVTTYKPPLHMLYW
jgi:hypothetical protein